MAGPENELELESGKPAITAKKPFAVNDLHRKRWDGAWFMMGLELWITISDQVRRGLQFDRSKRTCPQ
jgi:hypothetical protein